MRSVGKWGKAVALAAAVASAFGLGQMVPELEPFLLFLMGG